MPAKLKKYIVCPYCGYHYSAKKKRCPFCGTYRDQEVDDFAEADIQYVMEPARSPWKKIILTVFSTVLTAAVFTGVGFGCYMLYDKLMESVPKQEETDKEGMIGSITVIVSGNIIERDQPSITGDNVGDAYFGKSYNVYEKVESDGYTWYRIDDNTWVPDDGTWVKFFANEEK